ncbi:hypothetical protein HMN09_01171200 [Mycena chlorophos]|uniref:Uncharacterized protein n=1 Tax=Mycena chlorophos TaxID=658473 RepID=A0A8H6VTW1_MYCCL|nr:hypothetical protein HMN09_01171200 [Mycena chlorophos]
MSNLESHRLSNELEDTEQRLHANDEPRLPPELEREVFETAAVRHRSMTSTLMRIARRVHDWMKPLLYDILAFKQPSMQTDTFLQAIASDPTFAARSVRHIFFEAQHDPGLDPLEIGLKVLQQCTGVVRFGTTYTFTGRRVLDALGNLPNLRYLTAELSSLLSWDVPFPESFPQDQQQKE